tara:strand:+ start:565 stop:1218 length:654 start_codon:yes stop_codon:yes gene_type:complete
MKITLPESIKDITLGEFQAYDILVNQLKDEEVSEKEFVSRKISLFSGIPYNQLKNVLTEDLEDILNTIDKALNEECYFESRFTLDGIDFGFIDNLNDVKPSSKYGLDNETSGAYFDMINYSSETETLHKLMCILFRPIKSVDAFGNYKVKKYKGTSKYGELMKQMPLNIVNGCLVFFLNLSRELEIHILKSTKVEQVKEKKQVSTLNNGDGTAQSTL